MSSFQNSIVRGYLYPGLRFRCDLGCSIPTLWVFRTSYEPWRGKILQPRWVRPLSVGILQLNFYKAFPRNFEHNNSNNFLNHRYIWHFLSLLLKLLFFVRLEKAYFYVFINFPTERGRTHCGGSIPNLWVSGTCPEPWKGGMLQPRSQRSGGLGTLQMNIESWKDDITSICLRWMNIYY